MDIDYLQMVSIIIGTVAFLSVVFTLTTTIEKRIKEENKKEAIK